MKQMFSSDRKNLTKYELKSKQKKHDAGYITYKLIKMHL